MTDETIFSTMFPDHVAPYPVVIVIDPNSSDDAGADVIDILFGNSITELKNIRPEAPYILRNLFAYFHSEKFSDWSHMQYYYAEYKSEKVALEAVIHAKLRDAECIKWAIKLEDADWPIRVL